MAQRRISLADEIQRDLFTAPPVAKSEPTEEVHPGEERWRIDRHFEPPAVQRARNFGMIVGDYIPPGSNLPQTPAPASKASKAQTDKAPPDLGKISDAKLAHLSELVEREETKRDEARYAAAVPEYEFFAEEDEEIEEIEDEVEESYEDEEEFQAGWLG